MEISKIDKNFASFEVTSDGKKRFSLPCEPFTLYGGAYDESTGFVRMDQKVAASVSDGVNFLSKNGAGIRLNFSTDSSSIKLIVKASCFSRMRHMPLTGSTGFVLCKREGGKNVFCTILCPEWDASENFEVSAYLDGKKHDYLLYFPTYSSVEKLQIELDAAAYVGAGEGYAKEKPVLYYGSSITQGGCASRADNLYQDLIAERVNVDYIDLGFSGSGKAEDVMVDYLREIDCSVFVCDYDHNAPTTEYLESTHERLYKRYREKRPDTPVVFVTAPVQRQNDWWDARAKIVYATYEKARESGDNNVYFVDGREFFPKEIAERCQVDGCHPNDLGFYFMAQKIGAVVEEILQKKKKING